MFIVKAVVSKSPSNFDAGVTERAIGVLQKEKIYVTASTSAVTAGLFLDLGKNKTTVLFGHIRDIPVMF